jgi:hypothetical protein
MAFIPITIYLLLCVAVAVWGRKSRAGFFGVLILSVFLTPFLVFLGILVLTPRQGEWRFIETRQK